MIRSLLSGLSGIKSHQISLDVIGNNIANINTPAFKTGRASFSDTLSSVLRSGTPPSESRGGLNPMQIGRGSTVGTIDTLFTQGSMETTNNPTDLGIAGKEFFVLRHGEEQLFTRDGSFAIDANGTLIDPTTGYVVQGKIADSSGRILSSAPIADIVLPIESLLPARATSSISLTGNLNASAGIADTGSDGIDDPDEAYQTSVLVYDSLGDTHTVTITFGLTDTANEWTWEAALSPEDPNSITVPASTSGTLHFNADGSIDDTTAPAEISVDLGISGGSPPAAGNPLDNGAEEQTVTLNFAGLVQFAGSFTPVPSSRDGHRAGTLDSISFDETGTLIGTFTNGARQALAQIALADFYNPAGLTKAGENLYSDSMNSGAPLIGIPGSDIRATIIPGALEGSNVDLASEFIKMIIAQRGFEANSRVIATSNAILGELINLKR